MDYIFRWLHLRFLAGEQQSLFENFRPKSSLYVGPEGLVDASLLPDSASSALSSRATAEGPGASQLPLRDMGATTPPQGGLAPEVSPTTNDQRPTTSGLPTDRGVISSIHAATA